MSLFDQFQKIVTNPGAPLTATQTPEQPPYLSNLDQSIDEAWERLSALFFELGKIYYEQHKEDHQTEYEDQLSAIRNAHAEIDHYQELADEVSARKRCSACGAELMEGAVFCSICGARVAPSSPEGQKVCPQCHAAVDPEDAFCSLCGAGLRSNEVKEEG